MTERTALMHCIDSYYDRSAATEYLSRIFHKYSEYNIADIFVRQGIHFPRYLPVATAISPERKKQLQDLSLSE